MPNFWPFGRSKRKAEPTPEQPAQARQQPAPARSAPGSLEETVGNLLALCDAPRRPDGSIPYEKDTFVAVDDQLEEIAQEVREGIVDTTVGLALNWGAYLGEMLRQRHGGSWSTLVQVVLPARGAAPPVTPALYAYQRIMGAFPVSTEAYVGEVERHLAEAPTVAQLMENRYDLAVALARSRYDKTLDGTPESIKVLDQILDREVDTLPNTANQTRAAFRPGVATHVAYIWGAYVGEVMRRNHGGEWQESASDPFTAGTFCPGPNDMMFPVQKVYKRLINGPEDALWAFYMLSRHVPEQRQ